MTFPTINAALDHIRDSLNVPERQFLEMPIGEVLSRLNGQWPYHTRKWTRGELARYVAERDGEAALEVCQYLDERGPRVVAWDDDSDRERARDEAYDAAVAKELKSEDRP